MSRSLRLLAPAKINWTLEILHRRSDGFHEIRSVLQTIELCDTITLAPSAEIELNISGDAGPLADAPLRDNLAFRAAEALRRHRRVLRGVRIDLQKRVPVAAGLGGGSSDAAAVLRGCNLLWELEEPELNLVELAGEIGSDPPFFIVGGTAAVRGRGEQVRPLPEAIASELVLATPSWKHRGEKTAAMFRALTPKDYSEGEATRGLEDVVTHGRAIDDGELINAFERIVAEQQPHTARAMDALRRDGLSPHLAGSGPSFFVLLNSRIDAEALARRVVSLGFEPRVTRALPRAAAVAVEAV